MSKPLGQIDPVFRHNIPTQLEALESREVPAVFSFDFGTTTSPAAQGYTGVPVVAYTTPLGYGWENTSGISAVDRGGANALTRDAHTGTSKAFLVDVPNGQYDLTLTLGDLGSVRDLVTATAEGTTVVSNLTTLAGQLLEGRGRVTVTDGQLTLQLTDGGGQNSRFAVAGLKLSPVNPTATGFWGADATPAVASWNDSAGVEVGMKFQSSVGGSVSGVRFYKGAPNAGTHTGSLWSATGQRLATVTFQNETATGWQTATFNSPVAISPNTTYVVSYFAPRGGYAADQDFFAASSLQSGALRALSAAEGGNGVYKYGTTSGFPNQSFRGTNYWVDVVFQSGFTAPPPTANAGADRTAAEGGAVTFAGSATGSGLSYLWSFGDGTSAPGSLTPTKRYADNGTYTVTLTVTDAFGRTATDTAVATVANVNPTATLSDNNPLPEGSPVTVSFGGQTDPSTVDVAAGFRYSYDFNNDGTWDVTNSTSATARYTFQDNGVYTVRGRITDKDGGFSEYTTDVEMSNVNPTATLSNSGPATVGQAVTVAFAGQFDPSAVDTAFGFRYSYDFTNDGTWEVANSSGATAATTFTQAGTYTVRGRIADKDGGFTDYTTSVTVTASDGYSGILRTVYVSATGTDNGTGSATNPWKTLQYAANNARAGDKIVVRAGTYTGFQITTSGTATNPIVFKADPGVLVNAKPASVSSGAGAINLEGASYVAIDGFTVTLASYGSVRSNIRTVANTGAIIRNCVVDGASWWGILAGFSERVLIENNRVSNTVIQHGIYVGNSADNPIVRNNTLINNRYCGIQLNSDIEQGGDGIISNAVVEGNSLYDNAVGGGASMNFDGVQNSLIRNNVIMGNRNGIALYQIDGSQGAKNNTIVGNTIVFSPGNGYYAVSIVGGGQGSTGNKVFNNILWRQSGGNRGSMAIDAASMSGFQSDYNVVTGTFNLDPVNENQPVSLAQWRSLYGLDLHSVIVSDPNTLFADLANRNFRLKAGAAAVDAGVTLASLPKDLLGASRPINGATDIGAFERPTNSDTQPPAVQVTSPSAGVTLTGTVTLTAAATDNIGVLGVQFYVDGVPVGPELTAAPYSVSWDSTLVGNGGHVITAKARDADGNVGTSAQVSVTVQNANSRLVAAFGFNEGSGTTLGSSVGGLSGTISNATWVPGGRYGRALSFNGTNSIVRVANSPELNTAQALTIEAWVKPSALSSWNTILMKEGSGEIGYGLYAQNDGGKPTGYANVGYGDTPVTGTSGLAVNTWAHLAMTYDGNSMKLFVNGTLVSSQALTGTLLSTTGGLSIGGNTLWGEYFNGVIDEVRVYSRALTATEIQTDMNTPI